MAATGEEALALFSRHHPDVTLMDLQLPGISGLEAIKRDPHRGSQGPRHRADDV